MKIFWDTDKHLSDVAQLIVTRAIGTASIAGRLFIRARRERAQSM